MVPGFYTLETPNEKKAVPNAGEEGESDADEGEDEVERTLPEPVATTGSSDISAGLVNAGPSNQR